MTSNSPASANAKRRILVVIDSLGRGGAEKSTAMMLGPLMERGFDMEVATLYNRLGYQELVRSAGAHLHQLVEHSGWLGSLRDLRRLITATRPDLVHTNLYDADILGRLAARSARIPSVSTLATERYGDSHVSGTDIRCTRLRASQAIDVVTARMSRRLHAVSAHVADTMSSRLRYPRNRIDVVHRGRPDPVRETAPEAVQHLRATLAPNADFVVLAVARHEPAKGIDRLLDAWAKVGAALPDGRLLIAGNEGSATPELRRIAHQLDVQDSVSFLGHRDDISALHAISDLFVLPSRREGLPGSLLEAIALHTPSIVADLPQIREVVTEREAWLVEASDPDKLGRAIFDALSQPDSRQARAQAARRRFDDDFTLDRAADGMATFYTRALAG